MKFVFATLTFIFIFSFSGNAQVYTKPFFGLKAGLTSGYSDVTPTTDLLLKYKSDLHIGGFYRVRTKKFAFQPELVYTNKGGTVITNYQPQIISKKNYNYIAFTPTLGYIITEGLTLEAAPMLNYALNSPATNGPAPKFDYGISAGFRYDFLDMLEDFSLNVRYDIGTQNLSNIAGQTTKSRALQVSFIYNFYKK